MKKSLRILCITQNLWPDSCGGVERVANEIMSRLAARGHSVDLVGQRADESAPEVEERSGLTLHRYGSAGDSGRFGGRTLSALRSSRPVLSRLLAHNEYDVVLPHHFFPYYAYLGIADRSVPEILTFHASFWQELRLEGAERLVVKPLESLVFGGLARRTETTCLRRAHRVVVLSEFSRDQLGSYYPFALEKTVKIPGGVDLDRFQPAKDRRALRESLGLPADRRVLFTARRLVPRMGLSNLMEAFAQVAASDASACLVIAGRGRLEGELRRQADELGVSDSVRFAGFVPDEDLVRYYQAADVFVLPTIAFEGFGMVTLEALACGTPSIGTPVGATPEILRPLAPQLVLDGVEPRAIVSGLRMMLEWLSDENEASGLRSRCRRYVVDGFGWDRSVDRLEDLMRDLVEGGAR